LVTAGLWPFLRPFRRPEAPADCFEEEARFFKTIADFRRDNRPVFRSVFRRAGSHNDDGPCRPGANAKSIRKPSRKPRREARGITRGAIEISLPNGARVSVDAEVDEAALRLVLSAMKEL
jgi:hypothetical protein